MRRAGFLIALAACGPEKAPSAPAATSGAAAGSDSAAAPMEDPSAPPSPAVQEARLAAIQKAMNDLRPAAQQCWAAAATARFDIEGELTLQIDIAAGSARASLVRDTARNPPLSACVVQLLSAYRWAPPLVGQTIQLPFKFSAPDGQSTIDRGLVAWNAQGKIGVRVLLDKNNTGNDAASMIELAIAAGGTTGHRWADRAELWYFLSAGEVTSIVGGTRAVAAGDMMYVPKHSAREVRPAPGPAAPELRAMIVIVPGGREGTVRSGAMANVEVTGVKDTPAPPVILPASAAKTYGPATIFTDALHDPTFAASILQLPAGGKVPEHVHAHETEVLYVLAGSGTMTVNGVALPVTPTSVVQIPQGAKHGFTAATEVRAVQIYTPAGPEQRFKARP